jgi:hypothetical protein
MAFKSPLNFKAWLPQQDQIPVIECDQEAEMGRLPSATRATGSLAVLDDDLPSLQEVLGSDSYQVALVPRNEWGHIRGPQAEPFSAAATAVLLPFSWRELVARVCEFVRDSSALAECRVARFEDVCVDFTKMEVSRSSGDPITLTAQEFKTLKCFLLNPDRVLSREELLSEAWGYDDYPSTRTVDNHVLKLRQKLERDPARPVHFRTVHGVGYKFVP